MSAARIPLRARNGMVRAWTIVDPGDYAWLNKNRWCLNTSGYAIRGSRPQLRMHRVLMGLAPGDEREVDHINGERLDNRRANLRILTRAQNLQNVRSARGSASRYRGVWRNRNYWVAEVQSGGRRYFLGRFVSEEEAGRAAAACRAELLPFSVEALTTRDAAKRVWPDNEIVVGHQVDIALVRSEGSGAA